MNTANKLTLLRVLMIPLFLVAVYLRFPFHMLFALIVFLLACITDFVDGYIARHYDQVTDFGKFMDPLADKVLVMAALLCFVEMGRLSAWALLIVIVREFAVTALRLIAAERGRVIAAAWSGKVKTASTMVCICLMLAFSRPALDRVCTVVILASTVYSGIEYFVKNKDVIDWSSL